MTAQCASKQNEHSLPTAKLTVYFDSEHNALALPFVKDEINTEVSPKDIFALSDTTRPYGIFFKDDKDIIEHILIANQIAYNVKSMKLKEQVNPCAFIYELAITKAQQGDIPLTIGNVILLNRIDGHGLSSITLVNKDAPHHYKHLPYGMRPDSAKSLRELKVY